jgi:hypothetical protein
VYGFEVILSLISSGVVIDLFLVKSVGSYRSDIELKLDHLSESFSYHRRYTENTLNPSPIYVGSSTPITAIDAEALLLILFGISVTPLPDTVFHCNYV